MWTNKLSDSWNGARLLRACAQRRARVGVSQSRGAASRPSQSARSAPHRRPPRRREKKRGNFFNRFYRSIMEGKFRMPCAGQATSARSHPPPLATMLLDSGRVNAHACEQSMRKYDAADRCRGCTHGDEARIISRESLVTS